MKDHYIILLTDATAEQRAEIRVLCHQDSIDADRMTSPHLRQADRFRTFDEAAEVVRMIWHDKIIWTIGSNGMESRRLLPTWHPTIVKVCGGGRLDFSESMRPVAVASDQTATQEGRDC